MCANIHSRSAEGAQPFAGRGRQGILSKSNPQGHQQARPLLWQQPSVAHLSSDGWGNSGRAGIVTGPGALRLPCGHRDQMPAFPWAAEVRVAHIWFFPVCRGSVRRRVTKKKKKIRPLTSQPSLLVTISASLACSIYSCAAESFHFKCSPIFGERMNECGYLVIPDLKWCQPKGCGILGSIFWEQDIKVQSHPKEWIQRWILSLSEVKKVMPNHPLSRT